MIILGLVQLWFGKVIIRMNQLFLLDICSALSVDVWCVQDVASASRRRRPIDVLVDMRQGDSTCHHQTRAQRSGATDTDTRRLRSRKMAKPFHLHAER